MKFNNDIKEVKEFSGNEYFKFGVHKVKIALIEVGKTDKDQEFVEVHVVGEDGQEDSSRVWFTTEKAANYSFNVLRQIYVHNAPEAKKDDARSTIDGVQSTEELVEKLNDKLIGKECWFTKYYDLERTYKNPAGETKRSVNKNIYGYEPKLRPELLPTDGPTDLGALGVGTAKDEPFEDSPASNIPSDGDWDK